MWLHGQPSMKSLDMYVLLNGHGLIAYLVYQWYFIFIMDEQIQVTNQWENLFGIE